MNDWKMEITRFLGELEAAQARTLEVLRCKQEHLAASDVAQIKAIEAEEQAVLELLKTCLDRRERLLREAAAGGYEAGTIEDLVALLPENDELKRLVRQSISRTRQIRFQSLTNWMLTQRSILHLNQLVELIVMNGGAAPTYNRDKKRDTGESGGRLVDRVA